MTLFRALIIGASALAMATAAQAGEVLRMGGGPSGGAWHPAWSAGTQLLNQKLGAKYTFQYTPTAGSVDNARKVRLQELASGWAHIPQVYESWYGTGGFKKDGPNHDFRVIGNVRQQTQIIAVLADSPIKSFSDMKGKVVSLLNKGSGSSANCVKMFTALGLMDKIEQRYMDFSASARALGDRQIDVFCSAGVPYKIPALTQLSLTKPVRYISLTPEEQKMLTTKFKFYAPVTIPVQADVKGMDKPALTIGYDVWWIVSKKMSDAGGLRRAQDHRRSDQPEDAGQHGQVLGLVERELHLAGAAQNQHSSRGGQVLERARRERAGGARQGLRRFLRPMPHSVSL